MGMECGQGKAGAPVLEQLQPGQGVSHPPRWVGTGDAALAPLPSGLPGPWVPESSEPRPAAELARWASLLGSGATGRE